MPPKCKFDGCETQPTFNMEDKKIGLYCSKHKKDGMVNVTHKRCIFDGCRKQPHFNYEDSKAGLYCSNHKLNGMIDVKNKKCEFPNCKKQPHFNYEDSKAGLYCSKHKLDDMIDVISKTCKFLNCKKRPLFNTEDSKAGLYCSKHKLDDMIDVISKTCEFPNCKKRPHFNYEDSKAGLYCSNHKLNGMINITGKFCKSDWCYVHATDKYDGYCLFCFVHLFPEKPVSRNYRTKEHSIVEFVKDCFPRFDWKCDKTVSNGCSRRRPDMLVDLGYHILIIEIDENQHEQYDCSCENKRLMELSKDVNHRPIVFIRFNPDEYEIGDKKIKSCWSVGNNGIYTVKKNKMNEWEDRLVALHAQIEYWLNPENKIEKTIEVIELFYDSN